MNLKKYVFEEKTVILLDLRSEFVGCCILRNDNFEFFFNLA